MDAAVLDTVIDGRKGWGAWMLSDPILWGNGDAYKLISVFETEKG